MSSTNLVERAILVDLDISNWSGTKRDPRLSRDIVKQKKAERGAGYWWTRIVPASSLRPVHSACTNARKIHAELTLPWNDMGARLLPSKMFFQYMEKMQKAKDRFTTAVANFIDEYPSLLEAAEQYLGELFDPNMLPSVEEVKHKFTWNIRTYPIPTAGDFRVDLSNEVVEAIQKSIEDRVKASYNAAMEALWQRVYDIVHHVAERLSNPDNQFRKSLITNAKELCDLLPKLNVANDVYLEKMRRQIEIQIANKKAEELRNNPIERKNTANAANDILNKVDGYIKAWQK